MKERIKRGSLTVEASFVIPFLILIICAFLCLCLYLHDRSVLSSCAAEMAGKGAMRKYQSEEALEAWLNEEARELAEGRLLALREFEVSAVVTSRKVTVCYIGTAGFLGGLEIREQEAARRFSPVELIRGSSQLKGLLEK